VLNLFLNVPVKIKEEKEPKIVNPYADFVNSLRLWKLQV
jgi:hypothetical protein